MSNTNDEILTISIIKTIGTMANLLKDRDTGTYEVYRALLELENSEAFIDLLDLLARVKQAEREAIVVEYGKEEPFFRTGGGLLG